MSKRINKEVKACVNTLDRAQMMTICDLKRYREYVKILIRKYKDLKILNKEFIEGKKNITDTIEQMHSIELEYNTLLSDESEHRDNITKEINKLFE